MEKATADPLVGKIVAQYEIAAKLGGGGMGVVYAARDTKLGRRVALKFLPPQWSHDENAKQRFIREAQAASATDHRNICTIHDIVTADDGQLFIVMAYYEGQTLKQRLEAGPLSIEEAIDIAAQVAEGLAKAHAQGVVHRDIKPGNVMLTEDGVRILDFGLAKFADARFKLTLEGSTLGTIAYMSPEQARGEEAGISTDIWATGVVLYEMLAGDVPFRGAYPEAISHAIKNDPPPPLRTPDPADGRAGNRAIPEALEQIVFRALHKDPAVRFQTARDLARALRLLQGRTLPLDLRTEPLPTVEEARATYPMRRRWPSRSRRVAAAAVIALMIGTPFWIFAPIERIPVAVAPVVNQTGYAELDGYRLALTHELVAQLAESPTVRVLPYDRLLQIVRRFPLEGRDLSSREAMQALSTHSGAPIVIVPTLMYENGGWKGRIDFRNVRTATTDAVSETAPVVSSLMKDTAYGLVASMAADVEEHFVATGPLRASIARTIRQLAGRAPTEAAPRMRTLDAAAAFEQGLDAYEQQEYVLALRSFTAAAEQDARNPLPWAWRSRVARIMRRDDEAVNAGDHAADLLTGQTSLRERLFVEAVAAEARQDAATAAARHRELATRFRGDPTWVLELAAFQDRQSLTTEAAVSYVDALTADNRLARPHLELCRLYGPNRLNESAKATEHGQLALAAYRAIGARGGEAQTLMCLADALRTRAEQRQEARRQAEMALDILKEARSEYQLARGYYYVALVAGFQGRVPEAVAVGEQALAAARQAGNRVLEPLVLMNLGVANALLRNRPVAVDYYRQSSPLFEALGDQSRAAQTQSNAGTLLVEYGANPDEGLRDLRNALAVFRKLGDKDFEVFCLQVIARYYRYAGRHAEAEAELNRGLAIARERNNNERIASLTIDLAASRFETGDYDAARALLIQAIGDGTGRNTPRARIRLGEVHMRLGDFARAESDLARAALDQKERRDLTDLRLLQSALGHLAYESGRLDEARKRFGEAASSADEQPDASILEARAYVGWIDAVTGNTERGRSALLASLEHAQARRRPSLEALCRVLLARIDIGQKRFADALRTLNGIPPDDPSRTIGRELRAQVHHWRAEALLGGGDGGAPAEKTLARKLLDDLRGSMPAPYRATFASRRDIRALVQ